MIVWDKDMVLFNYDVTPSERVVATVIAPFLALHRIMRGVSKDAAWELMQSEAIERGYDRHMLAIAYYLVYRNWFQVQFNVD